MVVSGRQLSTAWPHATTARLVRNVSFEQRYTGFIVLPISEMTGQHVFSLHANGRYDFTSSQWFGR